MSPGLAAATGIEHAGCVPADPLLPEEVGCFIPEAGAGANAPQSNDVDVDERGIIYLIDRINGFDLLQFNP